MDRFVKKPDETYTIAINFTDALGASETLSSDSVTVFSGETEVSGLVGGSVLISPYVHVKLTDGTLNTVYVVRTTVVTSSGNTIIKDVEMSVEEDIPLDQMVEDIKVLASEVDEDTMDILMPVAVNAICAYCNNDFVMRNNNGYVTESVSMVFSGNTIIMTTTLPIISGDYIRVYGSLYNDGLYKIIGIDGTAYRIDKISRTETVICTLALVKLPVQFTSIISAYITSIMNNTDNISSEQVDDVEYTYFKSGHNAFLSQNSGLLNQYRNLYPDKRWL